MAQWMPSSGATEPDRRSWGSVKPKSRWYWKWYRCQFKRDTGCLSRDEDKTWPQCDKVPGKNDKRQQKGQVVSNSHQWLKSCRSVQEGGISNFILRFCTFSVSDGNEAYVKHLTNIIYCKEINKPIPSGWKSDSLSFKIACNQTSSTIATWPSHPCQSKGRQFYRVESSTWTTSTPTLTCTRSRLPPAVSQLRIGRPLRS